MAKIQKNLSDSDMFKGWHEQPTFETEIDDEPVRLSVKPAKKDSAADINSAYFTPELQESVGKALLELKLNLYKQGIVDYQIKVSCQDNQVMLTAVPAKVKTKPESNGNRSVHRGGK
ncbi:hypothetical protein SOV_02490 [Sporomusa ovata DSM 2662]|uniref:Uncharacterized protein n=1 Tax=Sporomusa ovata TaxID=2378 RepID=A0A0U1KZQ4_9FIRM|nr:hypothetical protein [Sporomusa ovata]EQB27930.1 hypothetical protein SOV_2c08410 [Sporomusa ovata DSM 2662]CQR72866.1 hypothetical protein SpAn4DRAFT_3326 [Sporomusa ovata]